MSAKNRKQNTFPLTSVASVSENRDYCTVSSHDTPTDQLRSPGPVDVAIGIPKTASEASWKDYLAIVICLLSCSVSLAIVFIQKWATYLGQQDQFILIGLCLTVMAWCTQPFVRRLFLATAVNYKGTSTLQTLDAILRSDPLTEQASLLTTILLMAMLGLAPGLSAAYKALGGGESSYTTGTMIVPVGLTGPPGTQRMGYGLSQFVNATLPWFDQPDFGEVYGFNVLVIDENKTAILDGPLPDEVTKLQEGLQDGQWVTWGGVVSAFLCFLNPDIQYNRTQLTNDFWHPGPDSASSSMWAWQPHWIKGLFLPSRTNNTNIYFASVNTNKNETFGDFAKHYNVIRQNCSATWRITSDSVQLERAVPLDNQLVDDKGLFTNKWANFIEQMIVGMVEYDTTFRRFDPRGQNISLYENVKTDATPLGIALWARFTAWLGPEYYEELPEFLPADQIATLRYERPMVTRKGAGTVKRGWAIIITLLANPIILFSALFIRISLWSRSPVGDGFGVISLLASVNLDDQKILDGAGLSGKLTQSLPVRLTVEDTWDQRGTRGKIIAVLGERSKQMHRQLTRGVLYE